MLNPGFALEMSDCLNNKKSQKEALRFIPQGFFFALTHLVRQRKITVLKNIP